ncbi:Hypothetical protein UVM_LOCUS215 [uncultured virus]|nr:Hypothetical protein UVM_LOCUS215 [uncultured virus]
MDSLPLEIVSHVLGFSCASTLRDGISAKRVCRAWLSLGEQYVNRWRAKRVLRRWRTKVARRRDPDDNDNDMRLRWKCLANDQHCAAMSRDRYNKFGATPGFIRKTMVKNYWWLLDAWRRWKPDANASGVRVRSFPRELCREYMLRSLGIDPVVFGVHTYARDERREEFRRFWVHACRKLWHCSLVKRLPLRQNAVLCSCVFCHVLPPTADSEQEEKETE